MSSRRRASSSKFLPFSLAGRWPTSRIRWAGIPSLLRRVRLEHGRRASHYPVSSNPLPSAHLTHAMIRRTRLKGFMLVDAGISGVLGFVAISVRRNKMSLATCLCVVLRQLALDICNQPSIQDISSLPNWSLLFVVISFSHVRPSPALTHLWENGTGTTVLTRV